MTLAPGTRLGRYEIRSLLGSGGMGEVYLARDLDLDRDVAVKILRDDRESGDRARRFIQEAKAASALHHPNVAHVYEIGSQDDLRFIAMEVVEGETLRDRIGRGTLSLDEAVSIATQITSALAAAHKQNVVHRDIKPENVIVSADGHAKVLDFGLAKLRELRGQDAETILKTAPGTAMGTLPYMAPENIGGEEVTAAADVFSLGVVIYEMLAGQRPFTGASSSDLIAAILSRPQQPLREIRTGVSRELEAVVAKCLEKKPANRYPTAAELLTDLKSAALPTAMPARKQRPVVAILAALLIVVALVASVSLFSRNRKRRVAEEQIATAERLVKEHRFGDAYDLVAAAALTLPANDRVRDLLTQTSAPVSFSSEPPGATVFARRFKGPDERIRLGITPLVVPRMARADYIVTFEKEGYATANGALAMAPLLLGTEPVLREIPPVRVRLIENKRTPPDMVLVTGGPYRLTSFQRPSERAVTLGDFFIDRHEVSNRAFEEFVRDGGYRRPDLWKHSFMESGRTLTFEQAMERFKDTTALPGPRNWVGGAPPRGLENHPVVNVTWYEAAAFAQWKGKTLPTIFQWEKASRYPTTSQSRNAYPWGVLAEGVDITERSNFLGAGTMEVDTMPFGMSAFGAYHMAGNVAEWCRNVYPPGHAARGGSYKDAAYAFGQTAALPTFYASPVLGFRCAKAVTASDEGDLPLSPNEFVPVLKPVDDRTFEQFRQRYEYARSPLHAEVTERIETTDWTREKIGYTVADKRVSAYLYLPRGFARPLQVIHFAPAGDVFNGIRTLPQSIEAQWAPLIRAGRALFAVELEGFLGRPRPSGWTLPDSSQDEYVDYTIGRVTEMRRGLDYLETRPEIDRARIAFLGVSAGGGTGIFISALESRYRAILFSGTGIPLRPTNFAPAADRTNFVPRISAPTLMLQGRYDEDTSLKSESEPMFRLLHVPKHLEVYEGGHIAPLEISTPVFTKWLDKTMGPVAK